MRKSTAKANRRQSLRPTGSALAPIEPEAAFVDVASGEHWVCIPEDRCEHNVRRFGAFTGDLHALRDWLVEHGIRVVGMESTGVYWINLYQILEDAGMEVGVVNARDMKYVKGRPKSDRLDCQWGQRLLSCGLLRNSFRPSGDICQMRAIWRMREQRIKDASRSLQRLGKMPRKARVDMQLRQENLKLLRRAAQKSRTSPRMDSISCAHELCGVDLTAVPGMGAALPLSILMETGTDMTKWPTSKHFCSWLGLCPNPRKSAGKDLGRRTKKCCSAAANGFRQAAASVTHSSSYLGEFYRRMRARKGGAEAICATAHKIATIYYTMIKEGTEYLEPDIDQYRQTMKQQRIKRLSRQAAKLGFTLTQKAA